MALIALMFVIALVGLIVSIGFIIAGAVNFGKVGRRLVRTVAPVKDSVVEIANTGKGIAQKGLIRYKGYAKGGKRIYTAVRETSEEVGAAAATIDVKGFATNVQNAASSVEAAQEALAAMKAVLDLLGKAK